MKAHELIDKPEKWTQGAYAKNIHGGRVWLYDNCAISFCAHGAIQKAYAGSLRLAIESFEKLKAVIPKQPIGYCAVEHWNDTSGYQTVYKTLRDLDI